MLFLNWKQLSFWLPGCLASRMKRAMGNVLVWQNSTSKDQFTQITRKMKVMVYFLIPILLSCVHEYSAHQAYKLGAVQDQQLLTLEIQVGTSSETACAIRCQRDANCRSSVFNGTSCSLLDYNPCPEMTPGDKPKMTKAGFTEECSSKWCLFILLLFQFLVLVL